MTTVKTSYTIPCSSAFRDAVLALAERRGVNAGDLARSVMLVLPEAEITAAPDPGDPAGDDRETVIMKSGRGAGRPWRRKPRLQVRLPAGHDPVTLRKALGLALCFVDGTKSLRLGDPSAPPPEPPPPPPPPPPPGDRLDALGTARLARLEEEVERLQTLLGVLSFEPLPHGVRDRAEALYVLGFPPGSDPGTRELRTRFRLLATVHHPDGKYGDTLRMSQLNAAMEMLRG